MSRAGSNSMDEDEMGMGAPTSSVALNRHATDFLSPDGKLRKVSEYDLAFYDRNDNTAQLSRKIMERCFGSVDVEGTGKISKERLPELARYLGLSETEDVSDPKNILARFPNGVTFDEFCSWFMLLDDDVASPTGLKSQKFSLMSAKFSEPFHQHQLIAKESGEKYTLSYRVYFFLKNMETGVTVPASPWHDVPLYVKGLVKTTPESDNYPLVNFVCEIPKFTRAKFEIARTDKWNPIKQDVKKGVPRIYKHGDMLFNYGAFSQTWEHGDIGFTFEDGQHFKGDNDPLDAVEIGVRQLPTGSVTPVKVLGVLGMVDDGEMDWKVVCVSADDPLAMSMDDIGDVEKMQPGALDALREWLRTYKIVDGKPENKFVFDGEYKNRAFTHKLIGESHRMWSNLRNIQGKKTTDK